MLTLICAADDPGGRVTHTQVQHFACGDEMVERGHHFFDGGAKVPPVDIQLSLVLALRIFMAGSKR